MKQEDYNIWDSKLWGKYKELFLNVEYTIKDGIINTEKYFNQPFRILYINWEPYDTDKVSYSLTESLRKEISEGKEVFKAQKRFRKQIKRQLILFSLLTNGQFWKMGKEQICEYVEGNDNENFFNECLEKIAYINLKKSDGVSESDMNDLRAYTKQGLEILKEQIAYCNPSIIIGGNIVDNILGKLDLEWGDNLYTNNGIINVFQLKIQDKLYPLFDVIHPSARRLSYIDNVSNYYFFIIDAIIEVEKKMPDFWKNQRKNENFLYNKDC